MSEPLTIAAAQSRIEPDVHANGRHIRDLVRQAADRGARLVQFPEGALSGYVKAQVTGWDDVDWAAVRGEIEATAALCAALGVWVVVGCNHRLTPPHRPHNSLYVISDKGRVETRYDKRLLSFAEINDWYSPGFEPCVFEAGGYRFGCALCIEIHFTEIFTEYERLGVDAVLFSTYAEDPMFRVQAQGHAAGNNMWISLVTPAQCSPGLASGLIGPDGGVIASCDRDGEPGLAYAVLDRAAAEFDIALNKARPWRTRARNGRIYQERRVDDARSRDRTAI